jgi:DNA modification methylase
MTKRKTDLDGGTWLQYSISIWSDIRKSAEEIALNHPALFPAMLPAKLISVYSHKDDTVLDPFAGTGSTLFAAQRLERHSYGIELSTQYVDIYHGRMGTPSLFESRTHEPIFIRDDANNLLKHIGLESIDLTVTSPPYWNILNQKRTADNKAIRNYGDSEQDLGNIESYQRFLNSLTQVFRLVYDVTKKGGFCCIILMDLRKKNRFYSLHIDTVQFMKDIGFTLDDIIIWDRRQEYNNNRPLGYPYVFRINKVHEYILIFKK